MDHLRVDESTTQVANVADGKHVTADGDDTGSAVQNVLGSFLPTAQERFACSDRNRKNCSHQGSLVNARLQRNGDTSNVEAPESGSESKGNDVATLSEALSGKNRSTRNLNGARKGRALAQSEGPSLPEKPADLDHKVPSAEPSSRCKENSYGNGSLSARKIPGKGTEQNGKAKDCNEETREKLQAVRVKLLRLALRLGQTIDNVVVSQVLYRLGLAEQLWGIRSGIRAGAVRLDRAIALAEEQEATVKDDLDFTCTVMLLGKTGVGKSTTINSIFDDMKSGTDAFAPATKSVKEITGTLKGIKLRVIDTPGLLPAAVDQRHNRKVILSIKQFVKKSPPDIVIYVDRLDMPSTDNADLPLLHAITDALGAAIWFNSVVVLTHAAAARPDGANGIPVSYDMFVAHRTHVVQRIIRQAAGDMRLVSPVSLVENHIRCRTDRAGEKILPNGQLWKPQLLLVCFASKILAEANSLIKLEDGNSSMSSGRRPRMPSLAFLLSSLLQSRRQLKAPDEQMFEENEADEEFEGCWDSEEDEDYNDLPPFRPLTKDELRMLDKAQRRAYFEEVDYRTKLLQKKQWREWVAFRREMREKKEPTTTEQEEASQESSSAQKVPLPDMPLPPSFDCDNSSYRYRHTESARHWLVKPVLENFGWDHDSGFEGVSLENAFVIHESVPISISGQLKKDKKEANIQMECAASLRHGEGKVTMAGLDIQTIGKNHAYTLHSDTRLSNLRRNQTTGGLAVTFFGNTIAAGLKFENCLRVGRQCKFILNGSAIKREGEVARGGSLEVSVRDKHYPIGQALSTVGIFAITWRGDLTCGGNLHSQFMLGRTTVVTKASVNNKGAGQLRIRASSAEQLHIVLVGIIPVLRALIGSRTSSQ